MTKITDTLREDLCTFVISQWILLEFEMFKTNVFEKVTYNTFYFQEVWIYIEQLLVVASFAVHFLQRECVTPGYNAWLFISSSLCICINSGRLTTIIPKRTCSSVASQMSAETGPDRGCGTVRPDHGSHTLQVAVICVYGNGWKMIGGVKQNKLDDPAVISASFTRTSWSNPWLN
jgi:hypothetical protein